MGFGTPPTVLEGDYSDWAIYDSFDDAYVVPYFYRQWAIVNKLETIILIIERDNIAAKKYTIATKTLGSAMEEYVFPGLWTAADEAEGVIKTVQGTYIVGIIYVVGVTTGGNGIVIWKDGVLIKTLTASELGLSDNTVYSVSISRKGKYVVVSGTRTASGNKGWVVLVGS